MFRGARGFVCALLLVALQSGLLFGTAAISGNLQDAGGAAISGRAFVRFWLRGCSNNQPRVAGVALIAPTGGPGYYKDFTPDVAGAISGALYKNSEVECNGATGNTWWGVQVYRDGKPGPETPYSVVAATFNLNTASPLVQSPPPPPATFPYIMANPLAVQTISGFALGFGTSSGISAANYNGSTASSTQYLRSNGTLFLPVAPRTILDDAAGIGGAGTLCLVETNGGTPAFASCAGSTSTSWSALSAPSANLSLSMGVRASVFSWGSGTSTSDLFKFDGSGGNGSGYTLRVTGQPSNPIFRVEDSAATQVFAVTPTSVIIGPGKTLDVTSVQPSGTAAQLFIFAGTAAPAGVGGTAALIGGNGNGGTGGLAAIQGGDSALGNGGEARVFGANAGLGGNGNGGNVVVQAGLKQGSGVNGRVMVRDAFDSTKLAQILPSVLPTATTGTVGIALTSTASLDFDLSGAGITCQDLTITVTGAADGDSVDVGLPNAVASTAGVQFSYWVSAANTVTLRACDITSGNPNPAAATVRAVVWKF